MRLLSAVLVVMVSVVAWGQATREAATEAGGSQVKVTYAPQKGFGVEVGGVPVIRGNSFQLYAPGWKEGYFTTAGERAEAKSYPARSEWLVEYRAKKVKFDAAEIVNTATPNRVEWTLGGTLESKVEARLEWAIGYINAFPLYGGTYAGPDGKAVKILPEALGTGAVPDAVSEAREIRFDTRLGQLIFKVEDGPAKLTLIDGRKSSRWWSRQEPSFWIGVLAGVVKPNEPLKLRVSMTYVPKQGPATTDLVSTVPVVAMPQALAPQAGPVLVIPKPKSMQLTGGRFEVGKGTRLVIGPQGAVGGARSLAAEAKERFGLEWATLGANLPESERGVIRFLPARDADDVRPEGYTIQCTGDGAVVRARDNAGFYYAAQTLGQMLQVENGQVFLPTCWINDWPTLAFRGVHMFSGRDAELMHRMIERVIGRYKFNHLVLESEYTQWETDEKIWTDLSVPKAQLAEYVRFAKQHMLEPVPLVQSLGHSEWMFKNGQNKDLAEDPEDPYAYSVTNPKTYEFIEKVYAEAMAVFGQPELFHIGHDEVTMRARYPYRPAAKELGTEKLFLKDTQTLHDWLERKGARTIMWGDVLLAKDEANDGAANAENDEQAKRMRDALPKDIVIADWHYTPAKPEDYKSLKVFRDAGFTTLACSWYDARNIATFAKAAEMYGAWGLLQTTWAGYSLNAKAVAESPDYAAYVLAAEYAWNPDGPAPADLPYRAADVFARAMKGGPVQVGTRAGELLNLSGVGNANPMEDFLGLEGTFDLQGLRGDDRREGVLFWSGNGAYPAILMDGKLLPKTKGWPRRAELDFSSGMRAREIALLEATAFPAEMGAAVGEVEVLYRDGTSATIPLRYGIETRALTDDATAASAPIAWSGKTKAGMPVAIRMAKWTNPAPEKVISGIRISSGHAYASPIVFGVTAVE